MKVFKFAVFVFAISAIMLCGCKNNKPNVEPGGGSGNVKTYIVISDVHLGDQRAISEGYGWNLQMRDTLCAFLDYLKENNDWDELIINGDLIDEWITMPEYNTFADNEGNPISEKEFFQQVVSANQVVFDKFIELKNAGHKIVYVPGNHDMQVTSEDFQDVFSGVFDQARTDGVDGMGEYKPDNEIFIEHGHRYDITNAPYIGKVGVDGIPQGSILPPGFFVSRINCAGSKNGQGNSIDIRNSSEINIYNVYWNVVGMMFGEHDVVTNTDGMTATYSFEDYAFSESKLFYGINNMDEENDGWNVRCSRNQARFVPSVEESIISTFVYDVCDKMGMRWLTETGAEPRILVWSHTHGPAMLSEISERGKVVYVNTGCWVDASVAKGVENTGTFCKIKKSDAEGYNVSLCRFSIDGGGKNCVEVIKEESFK